MRKNPRRWRVLAALAASVLALGLASGGAHASLLSTESAPALAAGDTDTGPMCVSQEVCATPSGLEDGLFAIQTNSTTDAEMIEYSLIFTLFDPALGDGTAIPTDDFEYWLPDEEDPEYGPLLPWGECLTDPENFVCPAGGPATPAGHLPEPGILACLAAALAGAGVSTRRRPLRP